MKDFDRFDAWMGRILVNECRGALRGRRSAAEVEPPADLLETNESPRMPDSSPPAETNDFDAAFDRLTVDQRAMLVLRHLHGNGDDQIAAWLGIPAGTVEWRLSRARKALAAQRDRPVSDDDLVIAIRRRSHGEGAAADWPRIELVPWIRRQLAPPRRPSRIRAMLQRSRRP